MSVLSGLSEAVRSTIAARIGASSNLEVEPILNWGGFVNRSFRIGTPSGQYHLKLTSDAAVRLQLQQWWSLRHLLEARYHAPRMVDWIDVDDARYSGPLFEWIPGEIPVVWSEAMLHTMSDLLHRLHNDPELRVELKREGVRVRTCADVYFATLHQRFTEDLRGITAARPPFVSEYRLGWMHDEVRKIEAQVRRVSAFGETAAVPTHGDVWLNNVLVTDLSGFYLLDWDELSLGDPAMDWAMLYGPSRTDPRPVTLRRPSVDGHLDPAGLERLPTWGRATLLDWIIDPLADWVEAASEPEHGSVIRASAEVVHERAVDQYLALWR